MFLIKLSCGNTYTACAGHCAEHCRVAAFGRDKGFTCESLGPGVCPAGSCVSVVGQDSYFKGGERNWELPDAIDHSWVLHTLQSERNDKFAHLIVFEGFKAYYDEDIVNELDLILWIRVNEETSKKRRMRNKSVTPEIWTDMWQHHSQYEKHWLNTLKRHVLAEHDAGCAAPIDHEKCVTLDGEKPAEVVLNQAMDVLFQRGFVKDIPSAEAISTSQALTSRSRSRSRGHESYKSTL